MNIVKNSSNITHNNHIVPQFYLKQWYNIQEQIFTYDFIHCKYEKKSSSEIGYLIDTYPQDIEELLGKEETKIAKIYSTIINKLQNAEWIQSGRHYKSILNSDEQYLLMEFLYLQRIRTITGRHNLLESKYEDPLSVKDLLKIAENQNNKLRKEIYSLSEETVYQKFNQCYWIVFRIPNHYCFWTSTNPVHYGEFLKLYNPIDSLQNSDNKNDCILLSLSPTLKLCIVYPTPENIHFFKNQRFHIDFLYVLPLNSSWKWKHKLQYKEKVMNAMNLAVIQGYEMQASICQENNGEIHLKASHFYILSKNDFTKNDKELFKYFGIDGIYNHI